MSFVSRLFATVVVGLAFAGGAAAAPASPESIVTLLTLTRTERLLDGMYANMNAVMQQTMRAALQGETITPEQQRTIDGMSRKFAVIFREEMSWPKLQPMYVRIYQESFTQDEVDGLIAFYRTPAGTALVEKMPLVMQRSMTEMQPLIAPMMTRMKAAAEEAVAEAKAQTKTKTKK